MNKITTVNGVLVAAQSDFADHAEDKTIHLTEEERTAWNAKADASALTDKVDTGTFTAHESNPTVHVTQEEREKWNAKNTKGVVTATQDGLDEHTENTTVHITEEERAAWNEAAAIPGASNAFTGDNTHAGTETFNGPVLLKGSVILPNVITHGEVDYELANAPFYLAAMRSYLNNLVDGNIVFQDTDISQIPEGVNFAHLKNLSHMFQNTNLTVWNLDLPQADNGYCGFANSRIVKFSGSMPKLRSARGMFGGCLIETFESDHLESLTEAVLMFNDSYKLREFKADLPGLINGDGMCRHCRLNKASTLRILRTIPVWSDGAKHPLDLGVDASLREDAEITEAATNATNNGWTVTITYN